MAIKWSKKFYLHSFLFICLTPFFLHSLSAYDEDPESVLEISHNSGFFSCCSIHLMQIIEYFNQKKELPSTINSSKQFMWYKSTTTNPDQDIKNQYFETKNTTIKYSQPITLSSSDKEIQFSNYKLLNYDSITPFIDKYFSPSTEIQKKITEIEDKYRLDYENLCVLFYRGNDKITETNPPTYDEFIEKALSIQKSNPNITFLIQSDETEFLLTVQEALPNSIIFFDEIRHMPKQKSSVDFLSLNINHYYSKYFLAITYVMSRAKHIICTSGNCSNWIVFFRGNSENVHQFLSELGSTKRYWY